MNQNGGCSIKDRFVRALICSIATVGRGTTRQGNRRLSKTLQLDTRATGVSVDNIAAADVTAEALSSIEIWIRSLGSRIFSTRMPSSIARINAE